MGCYVEAATMEGTTLWAEMERNVAEFASRISMDWMINCVVLLSMTVQIVLALGGSLRYRSSSSILKLVIWLAYMSADAVATYALGTMAHSVSAVNSRAIFGIWAPILLLHLGGPDTISAYSTPDNELWLRHLLTMLYQISVAAYVVYLSRLGGHLLAAALLLLMVGVSKYAERTAALRLSSFSQIVNSADPMNVFLQTEGRECNYLVMGLKQWRKKRLGGRVTIRDVWESERKTATENYLLCLSHALFKLGKRRYVNLYLQERYYPVTRKFFFSQELSHIPSPEKVFTVVEMELKFLYDLLFSKSSGTAFSKVGTVMRLVNISLLGVVGFLIYWELRISQRVLFEEALHTQRTVAYVLLSVALLLEVVQFCRILASDWTMVWLISARIRHSRGRKCMDSYKAMLMQTAMRVLGWFRKRRGGKYWRNEIQQYSIVHSCRRISPHIWKFAKSFDITGFITGWYTEAEPVGDDLKRFLVEQLKQRCREEGEDVETCRARFKSYDYSLEANKCEDLKWASAQDQEHLILHWHVATTICEMQYEKEAKDIGRTEGRDELDRNVGVSRRLSRYCAYLLVSRPKLLPLHPDIAQVKHMEVHDELVDLDEAGYANLKENDNYSTVGHGAKLSRQLLQKPEVERWKIIADYWAGVVIFYGVENKAAVHAEQLTVGGEFLTLLWAILGHMGLADQGS